MNTGDGQEGNKDPEAPNGIGTTIINVRPDLGTDGGESWILIGQDENGNTVQQGHVVIGGTNNEGHEHINYVGGLTGDLRPEESFPGEWTGPTGTEELQVP